jgi:uncharacterized protein YciI
MKTYIYVLKLIPRLQLEENWTDSDNQAVNSHFAFLQQLQKEGKLILAGKTDGLDENTFGIVIFRADNHKDALQTQSNDPAVINGIMHAELYPYTIALSSFSL